MGCCGSSAEKPRQKPDSVSYAQQGSARGKGPPPNSAPNMGGGPGYPPYQQQAQPYRQQPAQLAPNLGYTGAPPPQLGAVPRIPGGPTMTGGALVFLGLYKYEARTAEDLSFEKGVWPLFSGHLSIFLHLCKDIIMVCVFSVHTIKSPCYTIIIA